MRSFKENLATIFLGLCFLFSLHRGIVFSEEGAKKPLIKISFLSVWTRAPVLDSGYFIALEKGFYKDEGLDLSVEGGSGSIPNTELIGQKKAFVASANVYNTIRAKMKGIPVISIGMLHQSLGGGIVSLKERNIKTPYDLKGKKVAILSGTVHEIPYKALMKRLKINRKDIEEVMTPETVTLLLSKKVDACTSAIYHAPVLAEVAGQETSFIDYKDYGLDCYGVNLIVHEDSLKENPQLIRAFLKASIKGWEYASEHRGEAVNIILKYNPAASPKYIAKALERMLPYLNSPDTDKMGLFSQNEEMWRKAQDILFDSGELTEKKTPKMFFTNDYLPKK